MKKSTIFSTLFVALLVLAACDNRSPADANRQSQENMNQNRDRNGPQNPNQNPQGD